MANLLSRVSFLERKLNKLKYQLELNASYPDVYFEKLKEQAKRKVEELKEKESRELLKLEIEALDDQAYVQYKTEDQLNQLRKAYDLKKRRAITSYYRKTGQNQTSQVLEETLSQITQAYEKKQKEFIQFHQQRHYDQDTLSIHKQKYEAAEISALERITFYEKHLSESNQTKLNSLIETLDQKKVILKSKIQSIESKLKEAQLIEQKNNPLKTDMPDDVILRIDHLTMQFGGLKAVDDLSFDVKRGEIFGLIGPNGAGKTTVFNCITQFYKATQGHMYYRSRLSDIITLNHVKVHDVIKQGIVRTFQNVELIWELNILDNMLVGAHSKYRSSFFDHTFQTRRFKREEAIIRAKAEKILSDLGLLPYKYFYPLGLPYGVLKKIELARTLMTNPSLIILDEPAAGLNDLETEQLAHTIQKIQKEYDTTIFLVEHDMGLVMSICDTICAISFGKKLAIGTPQVIQKDPVVQQAYLGGE